MKLTHFGMVNLKKYNVFARYFVLFLTFGTIVACGSHHYDVARIDGKQIGITPQNSETPEIEAFVKPYREKIDKDMNMVLANAPEIIDKKGEWQTTIGNLLSDVTLQKSDSVFERREHKHVDICLLNYGGIRAIIPKGDVTTRTAFEIMPFENSTVVVQMTGSQVKQIADYIIKEKKPHPLSGLKFTIGKDGITKNITIHGQPLDENKIYYVATSDYLSNGGDNMNFFKGLPATVLDYKLRDVFIDYFKQVQVVPVVNDVRISVE